MFCVCGEGYDNAATYYNLKCLVVLRHFLWIVLETVYYAQKYFLQIFDVHRPTAVQSLKTVGPIHRPLILWSYLFFLSKPILPFGFTGQAYTLLQCKSRQL